jgi:hypothetical protein
MIYSSIVILLSIFIISCNCDCHFAKKFASPNGLSSKKAREAFVDLVLNYDGRFATPGIGVGENGLTFDAMYLSNSTGLPLGPQFRHNFTAASKESLHVAMLALAIEKNSRALIFFHHKTQHQLLEIVKQKLNTYERFNNLCKLAKIIFGNVISLTHSLIHNRSCFRRISSLDIT